MIERRWFLALTAAMGASQALRLSTNAATQDAQIPFKLINGFITFPLTITGIANPVVGALNTGFTVSLIDSKRWTTLGGPHLEPVNGYAVISDAMVIDGTPLATAKLVLADGLDTDNQKLGVDADVLLGFDAFKGHVLTINFPNATMFLRTGAAAPASPTPTSAGPGAAVLTFEQYQPRSPKLLTFDGFAVNGTPITVQLDTMWTGNAILFPTKFATTPAFAPSGAPSRTYEEGDLSAVTVNNVTFAGKPFATDLIAYVPAGKASVPTTRLAGVVGTGMFSGRVVTLDFGAGTIAISSV